MVNQGARMVVNSLNYNLADKLIREKKLNYIQKDEQKVSLKFHRPVIDIGESFMCISWMGTGW